MMSNENMHWRAILDASNDAIFIHDLRAGVLVDVNRRAEEMYGYSRDNLIGQTIGIISSGVHPYTEKEALKHVRKVRAGHPQILAWQAKHADGTLFPVEVSVRAEEIDGRILVIASVRDVSERQNAELYFRAILNASNDPIFIHDAKTGAILDINRRAEEEFEISREQLATLDVGAISLNEAPYTQADAIAWIQKAQAKGSQRFEWKAKSTGGRIFDVEVSMRAETIGGRDLVIVTSRNITERKQIEEELRVSRQHLASHIQNTPLGAIEWDCNWRISEWNPAAVKIFGYRRDEILGQSADLLLRDADKENLQHTKNDLHANQGWFRSTNFNVTQDGRTILCDWYNTVLTDESGCVTGIASMVMDITESDAQLKALEKLVQVSSKESGGDHLTAMALALQEISKATYTFIGRKISENRVETLALATNNQIIENFEYDLEGTPCENVVDRQTCTYPENVADLFPEDHLLQEMGIEAYIGTPVFNHHQECLGLLVSLYDHPLKNSTFIQSMLELYAVNIGSELQQMLDEQSMAENDERLRLVLEATNQGMYDLNVQTGECIVSPTYALSLGYDPDTFTDTFAAWEERLHPDDREATIKTYNDYLAGRTDEYRTEFRQRTRTGNWQWMLSLGRIIEHSPDGLPLRMLGCQIDITSGKKAELQIRESKRQFKTLLSNLPGMAYRCQNDPEWTMDFASEGCVALTGYSPDELLNNRDIAFADIIYEGDQERVWDTIQAALENKVPYEIEYRIITRNGEERWVWERGQGAFAATGELMFLEGFINDISVRKLAGLQVLESERKYKTLVSNLPGAVYRCEIGEELRAEFVSDGIRGICGYEPEALCTNKVNWLDLIVPEDRDDFVAGIRQAIERRDSFEHEFRIITRDGDERWIWERGTVICSADGTPEYIEGMVTDITERKEAREALETSEKKRRDWLAHSPVCTKILDLDFNLQYMSNAGVQALNVADVTILYGKPYPFSFFPDSFCESMTRDLQQAKATGETLTHVGRVEGPDGNELWFQATIVPVMDDKGQLEYIMVISVDITERKKAEQELRESEERFKSLHNASFGGIAIHDQGIILECNHGLATLSGYAEEELIGMNGLGLIAPDSRELVLGHIQSGNEKSYEVSGLRKNGETYPLRLEARNVLYKGKQVRTVEFRDITKRKQAEQKLLELNEIQGLILNNSTMGIALIRDRVFEWVNPRLGELFQIEPERLKDSSTRILYTSEKAFEETGVLVYQDLAGGHRADHTVEFQRQDGTPFWCRLIGKALDPANPHEGSLWMFEDITERHQSQIALLESQELLRSIIDTIPVRVFWKDLESVYIGGNAAFAQDANIGNPSALKGKTDFDMAWTEEESQAFRADDREVIECGLPKLNFEEPQLHPDGKEHWLKTSKIPLRDANGTISGVLGIYEDITQQKEVEIELRRLSTTIEQTPEAVVITDTEGSIVYVNPAFEQNSGYTREEAIGNNPRLLKSDKQDEDYYTDLWGKIVSGEVWEGRIVNKRKDGTLYTEEATISPVRDAEGRITNYVAVKRDITEELLREEEFRQSQKMEAVGQLAGGVAHDFNNILQAILGFSEILMMRLDEETIEHKNVGEIHKSAKRASEMTKQLLAFSRKQPAEQNAMRLTDAVYDTEALLQVLLGGKHEIVLELDEEVHPIVADQSQITQIVMNLAVNARDAMPKGGRVTITTENITLEDPQDVGSMPGARPGSFVCLSITDTGCGMTKEVKERLFDPFFTTKAVGEGTGLGLSVVYGIIKQNKGWINVYSEEGHGTCFKIYLPAQQTAEGAASDHSTAEMNGVDILLVEDDEDVRHMVIKILETAGHRPTALPSAEEALELFAQDESRFDMLFSDMVLPDKDGIELADALRKKQPALPVLIYSGFRDQHERWKNLEQKNYHFTQKPFTVSGLLSAVHKTLNKPNH